jgi:hypothetical protein
VLLLLLFLLCFLLFEQEKKGEGDALSFIANKKEIITCVLTSSWTKMLLEDMTRLEVFFFLFGLVG